MNDDDSFVHMYCINVYTDRPETLRTERDMCVVACSLAALSVNVQLFIF